MNSYWLFIILTFPLFGFIYGDQVCEADHQCPDNQYCYESHLCVSCTDCSAYKRHNSKRLCSKSGLECGACLPGFEEEYLSFGRREFCIVSQSIPDTSYTINSLTLLLLSIFALLLILLIFGILAFWCRYNKKKARARMSVSYNDDTVDVERQPSNEEFQRLSRPPPYSENESHESQERVCILNITSNEELKLNQASVFQEPQPPYNNNLNSIATAPDIEDEEDTVPSEWTPGPGVSGGSTDFAGIFSISMTESSSSHERINETSSSSSGGNLNNSSNLDVHIPPGSHDSGIPTPCCSNPSLVQVDSELAQATVSNTLIRPRSHSMEEATLLHVKRRKRFVDVIDSGNSSQNASADEDSRSTSEEEHNRNVNVIHKKSKTLP